MPIEINDDLILQWEPKIQKLLANTFVRGLDKEDLEQELRIAIVKAARGFNSDKGVIFHTYLHTAMINTLRTLISKAQRTIPTITLDGTFENIDDFRRGELLPLIREELQDFMEDEEYHIDFDIFIDNEKRFLELRLEGFTMEEISQKIGESAYKLRATIQQKVRPNER